MATLNTSVALGALVDACISLSLRKLVLDGCHIVPAVLPQLTRLIAAGKVRELDVGNLHVQMFDETHESTRLFIAAVRASYMTRLSLANLGVLPESVMDAAAFINARTL